MSTAVEDIHDEHEKAASALEQPVLTGLLAEFRDVNTVVAAAAKVRREGYRRWDVHTPFPIHGIDSVMGTRATVLPWIVLAAGLFGAAGGIWLQWYVNAHDYAFPISGKPYWSLPANIPVAFECTILCAALASVFGMLALDRLPMLYNPIFKSERFRRATDDRFFIVIDAGDPEFEEQATEELLRSAGATAIERIED